MPAPAHRSYLFVPGNRPERYAKACGSGADSVIVDLEDAVPPERKDAARAALAEWLSSAPPVIVRVNAVDTEWFAADVDLCRASAVAAVMLPKTACAEDIELTAQRAGKPVVALIETARGVANAVAVAGARGTQRLAFGSVDLALDLGVADDAEVLDYFRAQLVLASRLGGIDPPVDGVTTALDDASLLADDVRRARRSGFGGKLCIHPKQVDLVNRGFAPSAEEVAWAHRIVEAARRAGGAAVAVDGKMVDAPVVALAERVLRNADR